MIDGFSQRALQGSNPGELWLVPVEFKDKDIIQVSEELEFRRTRGATYSFGKQLWDRKDGDECEEEPTHVYMVGYMHKRLVAPKP